MGISFHGNTIRVGGWTVYLLDTPFAVARTHLSAEEFERVAGISPGRYEALSRLFGLAGEDPLSSRARVVRAARRAAHALLTPAERDALDAFTAIWSSDVDAAAVARGIALLRPANRVLRDAELRLRDWWRGLTTPWLATLPRTTSPQLGSPTWADVFTLPDRHPALVAHPEKYA